MAFITGWILVITQRGIIRDIGAIITLLATYAILYYFFEGRKANARVRTNAITKVHSPTHKPTTNATTKKTTAANNVSHAFSILKSIRSSIIKSLNALQFSNLFHSGQIHAALSYLGMLLGILFFLRVWITTHTAISLIGIFVGIIGLLYTYYRFGYKPIPKKIKTIPAAAPNSPNGGLVEDAPKPPKRTSIPNTHNIKQKALSLLSSCSAPIASIYNLIQTPVYNLYHPCYRFSSSPAPLLLVAPLIAPRSSFQPSAYLSSLTLSLTLPASSMPLTEKEIGDITAESVQAMCSVLIILTFHYFGGFSALRCL